MLDEVIAHGTLEQRELLSRLLDTRNNTVVDLRNRLQSKSTTLWQKITDKTCPYDTVLFEVGQTQGLRPVFLESARDFELRLVRTLYKRTRAKLSSGEITDLESQGSSPQKQSFRREGIGAASIVAAQMSGFGVYQMATTVLGAASAGLGITVPFIGYMALTKGISIAIGPVGWTILGASLVHKVTKPKWVKLLGAVAWMCWVRQQSSPRRLYRGYSATELLRKAFKFSPALLLLAIVASVSSSVLKATKNTQEVTSASSRAPVVPDLAPVVAADPKPDPRSFAPINASATESSSGSDANPSALQSRATELGEFDAPDGSIQLAVEEWRQALLTNAPAQQVQPYANHMERYFLAHDWTKEQVYNYLQKLHYDGGFTAFVIRDLVVDAETDSTASVHFTKDFSIERNGNTTSAVVKSVLHFERAGHEWKINYERDFRQ